MQLKKYSDNQYKVFNKEHLNVYVCGPTVYDDVHIGNMRSILVMDIFANAIKLSGKTIFLVNNITDIDDKIINKAIEKNISETELTQHYTYNYFKILSLMNINNIDLFPKVTDNIDEMTNFIDKMVINGSAYEADGNVYFDVKKDKTYGENFKISKNDLIIDEDINKKDQRDFAL
jgi:cysteinyl-tRNA synthetase